MKGLVIFVIIVVLAVWLGYAGMGKMLSDDSVNIGFACGNPQEDMQEIQIFVGLVMPRRDPPKRRFDGYEDWERWVREHFILTASNGEVVQLERKSFANLIPSVGTEDSFLVGKVRTGETYTFDYVPVVSEGKHYRKTFTVGADGVPFCRDRFEPV